jgi:hypothetical protein
MTIQLGRIERVDLRGIWTSEGRDFTPWLAIEENLAVLGEALGIDLDLEAQEKDVGPFRADILCKNSADESWVVIENQIERTDHRHLGQLLTYAAGLKAVTIVWVSAEFCDEHRAALDWLNQMTVESVRFFGLEIELWKIGDSPAAPRFNVVSQPNDWQNTVRDAADAIATETDRPRHVFRLKYWTAFKTFLHERQSKLRPQKPTRDHWYSFGIGTSRARIHALLIRRDNQIAVDLNINDDKKLFNDLLLRRRDIELEIGAPLDWREMPDKRASRVVLVRPCNPDNEADWPQQFAWLQATLEKFDAAFRHLLNSDKTSPTI